jgi:transcriptional regulator with XRE-family HTH domain
MVTTRSQLAIGVVTQRKEPNMPLSSRLKIARESLGKSQKEIAALTGASYRAWQGYENGENQPGAKVIEALAKLGINANWLLTGKGSVQVVEGIPSQYAKDNIGVVQSTGMISGSITQGSKEEMLPDDIREICELLRHYSSTAFKERLKAQLLKIKEEEEARWK